MYFFGNVFPRNRVWIREKWMVFVTGSRNRNDLFYTIPDTAEIDGKQTEKPMVSYFGYLCGMLFDRLFQGAGEVSADTEYRKKACCSEIHLYSGENLPERNKK